MCSISDMSTTEVISFLLGALVGLGTNLFSWWIISHVLVPKIEFAQVLSKRVRKEGNIDQAIYRYWIKFRNNGKRDIIDLELTAILRIDGFRVPGTLQNIRIPLESSGESTARIMALFSARPGRRSSLIRRLYPELAPEFLTVGGFSEELREKARDKRLQLEDVLALGSGNNTHLQISALGYDRFSGARVLFQSIHFKSSDIQYGPYQKGTLRVKLEQPQEPYLEDIEQLCSTTSQDLGGAKQETPISQVGDGLTITTYTTPGS